MATESIRRTDLSQNISFHISSSNQPVLSDIQEYLGRDYPHQLRHKISSRRRSRQHSFMMLSYFSRNLPREGLYIDPLMTGVRKALLISYLALPLVILFRGFHLSSYFRQDVMVTLLILERVFMSAALVTILLDLNDYLSKWTRNNWTRITPWDHKREIVLVTGGSSGIGASIVRRLSLKETKIVVLDAVTLPKDMNRPGVHYYKVDLSDDVEIQNVCSRIRDEIGNPTVLINNAGLSRGKTIAEGSYDDNIITLRTNLQAVLLLIKECLPYMILENHGHIMSVSSMSAYIPPAGLADYAASKAGIIALHESMELELKFKHRAPKIRSSVAILGFVQTPLFDGKTNQSNFLTPLMHVDTIGDAIVDTLYSGFGQKIFYPGMFRYLAWIRGSPEWLQRALRSHTQSLQVNFEGRQRIDPTTRKLKA